MDPARLDMKRCAGGGIILSSVATRYQLGFVFHAGSSIEPLRAATPHGTCESAMNAAFSGVDVRREGRAELRSVEEQVSVLRRQDRRHRRVGGRILDERSNGLTLIRSKRGDIDESGNLRVIAGFGDDCSAVGVANQDDSPVRRVNDAPRDDDVIGQRQRRDLNDCDVVTVPRQDVVHVLPSGAIYPTSMHDNNIQPICVFKEVCVIGRYRRRPGLCDTGA